MKTIRLVLVPFLFTGLFLSCGKKEHPKIPSPSWKADHLEEYPVTMTAVVRIPPGLFNSRRATDELAAFINNECRGVGQRIQMDTSAAYFVLIHGKSDEKGKIQFKYYSASNSYLYQTDPFLNFIIDGNYGTADQPEVLKLKLVK